MKTLKIFIHRKNKIIVQNIKLLATYHIKGNFNWIWTKKSGHMKQSHVQDTTSTLVHAFSYSTRWMCTCLSSSAEKRWWIYSFTFRWRKYDQGRKGPLVNKESFFTTDQSTTLTNYIWYVYRHMCVLVYTCTIHVLPSQSQESEKRVSDANVHMYTCIQAMASPFLEFVDLMSAFVSYIHPHC